MSRAAHPQNHVPKVLETLDQNHRPLWDHVDEASSDGNETYICTICSIDSTSKQEHLQYLALSHPPTMYHGHYFNTFRPGILVDMIGRLARVVPASGPACKLAIFDCCL